MDYPAAYIELAFVSKKSRRLGVAKELFESAEKIIRKKGYAKIFSSTNHDNKISLNIHKKFGYKRCGVPHPARASHAHNANQYSTSEGARNLLRPLFLLSELLRKS